MTNLLIKKKRGKIPAEEIKYNETSRLRSALKLLAKAVVEEGVVLGQGVISSRILFEAVLKIKPKWSEKRGGPWSGGHFQ